MNMPEITESATARVERNFVLFDSIVNTAETFLAERQHESAAVCAQIAASHAFVNHCGFFRNLRLEKLLLTIGHQAVTTRSGTGRRIPGWSGVGHVLHVLNADRSIGGDSRYARRWIEQDSLRKHTLVLTRQRKTPVSSVMSELIEQRGGTVHRLDSETDSLIAQAAELRRRARYADLVVMHLFPDDVIPLIAFADRDSLPPIIFVNHSDHTFWLGVRRSPVLLITL